MMMKSEEGDEEPQMIEAEQTERSFTAKRSSERDHEEGRSVKARTDEFGGEKKLARIQAKDHDIESNSDLEVQ